MEAAALDQDRTGAAALAIRPPWCLVLIPVLALLHDEDRDRHIAPFGNTQHEGRLGTERSETLRMMLEEVKRCCFLGHG